MNADRICISSLRHRVKLCSAKDVALADGVLVLTRQEVLECWAAIEERRATSFAPTGFANDPVNDRPSHYITMRWRADIVMSVTAYFYEARLQSPPRWFKVLGENNVCEHSRFMRFPVRLIDRSDDTIRPSSAPAGAPRPQVAPPARPLLGLKS